MKKTLIILLLLLFTGKLVAQNNIVFQHLNTSNGLSYIGVNTMCVDQDGNLWIASGNGLNMFNGKTTEKYFSSEYPQLQSSNIIQVLCDGNNRIWVMTVGGYVTVLDENRRFHRIALYDSSKWVKTLWMLKSKNETMCLYTQKGNYAFSNTDIEKKDSIEKTQFDFLPIMGFKELNLKGTSLVFNYDENHYMLVYQEAIVKVNFKTNTVERKYNLPDKLPLIKWDGNSLLVYNKKTNEAEIINLDNETVTYPFRNIIDQNGKKIEAIFSFVEKIKEHKYVLSSQADGIYIYDDITKTISNHRHSFSTPTSLGHNITRNLAVGQKGWVFVNCIPHGISYFNAADIISNQVVFADNKGNGYDGVIFGMATRDNIRYYIGTTTGMMEWNRKTNSTVFIDFIDKEGKSVFREKEAISIMTDSKDRVWAATIDNGVIVMNSNRQLIKHFRNEEGNSRSIKMKMVRRVQEGPDGFIWLCGRNGICRINPDNFEVDNLETTPLVFFDSLPVAPLLFTDKENLWIASATNGIYHYNIKEKRLEENAVYKNYRLQGVWDIKSDNLGNIYIGNGEGVRILFKDGRTKAITPKDGLLLPRGEGLLRDGHNRIWIGNDIAVACYDPADSSLKVFDVRYGLSIYGFRARSYFTMPNGEFFLGTPKGLQYFHPDSLYNKKISLNVSITKIETKQITSTLTENAEFKLEAKDNQVTFYFGTVDYSPHLRTYYEYKLIDLDKDWIKVADQNSVRYNSLPAGKYVFKVRVSNDNKTWQESDNEVTITIDAPFYQSWWFRILGILLVVFLIWYVMKYYEKKELKHREELKTELVINYFSSQINSHQRADNLLWDVAKNLIGKLGFEECMIYLWNDDRTVLVQRAGYGSKGSMEEIMNRSNYDIPRGKGIVGAAVESKQSLLINDTSKDKRYFTVDEKITLSELCVPLIHDNEVLGAINIEHHQKNFFTQKHLQMLSTIAVLCANQLQRIRAEEEKQQARIEALQNKQKAVETRLQSLRLQMNPHFLFNALNSIQQMILANEEMVATRYLSRFSKLLRTILVHSDKETVTLKEEIEILKLYVELESIRFKDAFHYEITCDDEIDAEEVKIPTLLIQPFVENAIWHGLMHKEGQRNLKVRFVDKDEFIHCIIDDDGVGRAKAKEMKIITGQDKKHTSKGIQVSEERLKAIQCNGVEGSINIIDLSDAAGNASGTRVEIVFPTKNC